MNKGRRNFLAATALASAAPLIPSSLIPELAALAQENSPQANTAIADPEAFEFWTKQANKKEVYRAPRRKSEPTGNTTVSSVGTTSTATVESLPDERQPQAEPIEEGIKTNFAIYTPDKGFRDPLDIEKKELIDKGDLSVKIVSRQFRPSADARDKFGNLTGGSLDVAVSQQADTPFPPLTEALAWTAISTLTELTNKKLPAIGDFKYPTGIGTPAGQLQNILLPKGEGQWRWTFYVQEKPSKWSELLRELGKFAGSPATPVLALALGLPAISMFALTQVTNLMAILQAKEAKSKWLMKSSFTNIAGTKEARDKFGEDMVPLLKGTNQEYLAMPRGDYSEFSKVWNNYEMKKGLIVPKNTPNPQVETQAITTLPKFTYVSMYVTVDELKRS